MSFNSVAILNKIVDKVSALDNMQEVHRGVPSGFSHDVVALVAIANRTLSDKNTNMMQRNTEFLVAVGARTSGDESNAEEIICGIEDGLTNAWLSDRKLGGLVDDSVIIDRSNDSEYRVILGQEYRIRAYHWAVVERQPF